MSWTQRPEGGGRFALALLRAIALRCGRRCTRLLLVPITLYFLLVRGPERRASRAYLARILGRPARLHEVARHFHCFAATILDRVFLLSDRFRDFDVRVHGVEDVHAEMASGRGVMLLGAHLGSFEALRVLSLARPDVRIRAVLDKAQNPMLTDLLGALNPDIAATVIDAGQDGTAVLLGIQEAAGQGALVGMLGDRARPGERVVHCRFLGADAPFPVAPLLIASTLGIPVLLCFGLYRGGKRYDLHFERFSDGVRIPRHNRARDLAGIQQRYADRLEHYARLAPYNWFNFYDFWQADEGIGTADVRAGGDAGLSAGERRPGA